MKKIEFPKTIYIQIFSFGEFILSKDINDIPDGEIGIYELKETGVVRNEKHIDTYPIKT